MYLWSVNNSVYQYFQFFSLSWPDKHVSLYEWEKIKTVFLLVFQWADDERRVYVQGKNAFYTISGLLMLHNPLRVLSAHSHTGSWVSLRHDAHVTTRETDKKCMNITPQENRLNRKSCVWLTSERVLYLPHQHRMVGGMEKHKHKIEHIPAKSAWI